MDSVETCEISVDFYRETTHWGRYLKKYSHFVRKTAVGFYWMPKYGESILDLGIVFKLCNEAFIFNRAAAHTKWSSDLLTEVFSFYKTRILRSMYPRLVFLLYDFSSLEALKQAGLSACALSPPSWRASRLLKSQ